MKNKIAIYNDDIGFVELVDYMGDDLTIVNSARVSFGKHKSKLDEKDRKLIKYLIEHKHTSTFEHNVATFRFKVPLFIRSQHHRHRTWSYNEISRRYTDFNLEFYELKQFRKQSKSNRQASIEEWSDPKFEAAGNQVLASELLKEHHEASLYVYNKLLEMGVCREQARGVLPQNLYTEYYGTVSLRNALHFVELRLHDGAQWEIQQVAKALLGIMSGIWPVAIQAWNDNYIQS